MFTSMLLPLYYRTTCCWFNGPKWSIVLLGILWGFVYWWTGKCTVQLTKSVDFFSHFFFCLPFNADNYVNTEVLKVVELWTVCFHSAALAVFCVKWIKKSLVRLSVFTRQKIKPSIIFSWNHFIIDKLKRMFRYGTIK